MDKTKILQEIFDALEEFEEVYNKLGEEDDIVPDLIIKADEARIRLLTAWINLKHKVENETQKGKGLEF